MAGLPDTIHTWQMVRPWGKDKETGEKIPGIIELKEIPVPELREAVLVPRRGRGPFVEIRSTVMEEAP